jgi:hypothetical protein
MVPLFKMYYSLTNLTLGAVRVWFEILTPSLTFKIRTPRISTVALLCFEFSWRPVCVPSPDKAWDFTL